MAMIPYPEYEELCIDYADLREKRINDKLQEIEIKIAELQAGKVPTGTIMVFSRPKPPKGWLVCDGASLSWKEYPDLFEVIEFYFGKGDCPGTFRVPDLRGQFLRGYPGGDCDPCREFGSRQGDAIRDIKATFGNTVYALENGSLYGIKSSSGAVKPDTEYGFSTKIKTLDRKTAPYQVVSTASKYPFAYEFKASNVVPTAKENRPVNTSLLFCIKA